MYRRGKTGYHTVEVVILPNGDKAEVFIWNEGDRKDEDMEMEV